MESYFLRQIFPRSQKQGLLRVYLGRVPSTTTSEVIYVTTSRTASSATWVTSFRETWSKTHHDLS